MFEHENSKKCLCGSERLYHSCCGRYIEGYEAAPTPEALMRSRYTAFARQEFSYLLKTWHPKTRPEELGGDKSSQWLGLTIKASKLDGREGKVEFVAQLVYDRKLETLHELSNFAKVDGVWLYVDGEFKHEKHRIRNISKNEACPCGSGKKFKRCHGT